MSADKQLIRREIIARDRTFVAQVLSNPALLDFDQSVGVGGPVWAVDLDVGGGRVVKKVPVKASGSGTRFYAQLGQTVKVERTALGRLFVVAPGDASLGQLVSTSYSLETGDPVTSGNTGFVRVFFPFEFYQGPTAMKGNPGVTFAAAGNTITRQAQGLNPAGSFVDDGFVNGQTIQIGRASLLNNGSTTITNVTATVLTVAASLFDEGPLLSVTIGVAGSSLWSFGTPFFFPYSQLQDVDGNPV